ncbi:ankyrin repeat domain-containing protein [Shewanella sp. SG44-6]|uniref:ankyrin repeat domain-containing protein n=1 Tax=Shewanella sp. SG44-6 TaxID=2760959 RepID=UPI001601FF1C|nr:ankyrin repeat domain-containing protein [Shewanella sp. SG44-6]MBB1391445.1 ankyrin repeat domain-containing protein [Shewanella sp. SG44-6]
MRIIQIVFIAIIILSSAIITLSAEDNRDPTQLETPVTSATPAETSTNPLQVIIKSTKLVQTTVTPTAKQSAKKPAMGHDYQKNMPKLGKGEANYRGGKETTSEEQAKDSPLKQSPIIDEQHINSANVGYPEYRQQGGSAYFQHQQYANPPRSSASQADPKRLDQSNDLQHNPSLIDAQDNNAKPLKPSHEQRRALLHAAAFGDVQAVNKLLKEGASPDARAKDRIGRTALMLAALSGHTDVVNTLLKQGASVNIKDKTGHTALNWAANRSDINIVTILLSYGADINTQDNAGTSPLLYAIGTHNIAMVRLLLSHGAATEIESDESKMTPLLLAIEHNDLESINLLLDNRVNVNGKNNDNFRPLMAAAEQGQLNTVQQLIFHGAEVNQYDNKHFSALIYAANKQHIAVMEFLLAKGADINALDGKGLSIVMRARQQGHTEVIKLLCGNGAKLNADDC